MVQRETKITAEQAARLQAALTANAEELFQLVLSPHPEVLTALLRNPQFKEEHILALLKRKDLSEDLIKAIFQRRANKLSHNLRLALAKNPATSGNLVRSILPHLRLFELVDLCFLPGSGGDLRVAAEREIIVRLPTAPLGNKLTLARRATSTVVAELLQEGDAQLVDVCLNSPRLREAAVFKFINGSRSNAENLSQVARNSRWSQRPNLRMALLKNRRTPVIWFTLWLPKLRAGELRQLAGSRRMAPAQKRILDEQLQQRGLR